MSADFDHRLIDTLNAVAEQTETSKNWERVVADARPIRSRPAAPVFKSAPFAVAAIVATLAGLGVAFWLGTGDSEVTVAGPIDYLLPGEQLVRDDPLIVVSAPGPESQFPTGDLGTEVHLGVIDGVDDRTSEIISSIQELVDGWPGSSIVKITLLGEIRGDPWLLVFVDGPDGRGIDDGGDPDANFRVRLLVGPDGGHGQGDLAPVDGLYLIALPTITEGPTEALLTYGPWDGWISWDLLPAEAAVVTYTDTERQFWIRPRAGAAILPVQLQAGETFTLEVLDTTGKTISTRTETVAEDYIAVPKDGSPEYSILMPELPDELGVQDATPETKRICLNLSREAEIALDEAVAVRAIAEEQRFVGELTPGEESERSEMLDTAAMLTERANDAQERFRNLGC